MRCRLSAVAFVCFAFSVGCDVAPPNVGDPFPLPYWVLDKALFEPNGEWWVQRTMTQVPYEAGFTFVGDADYTDRIHWKVEERFLIAYRTDDIVFADDADVVTAPDSTPSLIYPITRHVDIIEGQQIEAPNKPWYERTHMVVDWGTELSQTMRFSLGSVETTGVSFWTMEPANVEEAPIFAPDYIDFTTHVVVSPSHQFDPTEERPGICTPEGIGSALYVDAINCAAMDVAYRTSFRKIPADNDYEPAIAETDQLPPLWFDRFFRVARISVDEQYGTTLPGRTRLVSRFNVWERSQENGVAIPLADRVVRPIVFHLNADFPEDLKATAQQAIDAWDAIFRSALKAARSAECQDAGGALDDCDAGAVEPERVVVLCHNDPVKEGDDPLCGPPGTTVRLGDLRFNQLVWVKQPSVIHPVGIAWWSPDIVTGETVAGFAKIYGEVIDKHATTTRDAVLLALGQIAPEDLTSGRYLGNYDPILRGYSLNPFGPQPNSFSIAPSEAPAPPLSLGPIQTAQPMLGVFRDQAFSPIIDSNLEALTLDADAMIMAGLDPAALDPQAVARSSTLRTSLAKRGEARKELARILAQSGGDLELPADPDLGSLIEAVGDRSPEEIYAEARRRFAFTVIAHELGHVFAIKHNFAGSYDALNYQPGYWQNRDTSCIGGRYRCPLTQAEQDAHLEDYAYASIMDYHASANSYIHGLGRFENAAIHALYGGVAEVFDNTALRDDEDVRLLLSATYGKDQVAHVPLVLKPDAADPRGYRVSSYHYSRYPALFGDLAARRFVSARALVDELGTGIPAADAEGRFVVPYQSCSDVEEGQLPYCFAYDHGADPFEIVTAQTNWFRTYYPFNSFRRGRLVFEPRQYISAIWSRVFLPIKRWNDWLVHTHFDYDTFDAAAYTDPDFLEPMQVASDVGFQFLAEVLATPEPGVYLDKPQPDGTNLLEPFRQPISHNEPEPTAGIVMTVNFPEGRIYQSEAAYDAGLILLNIGSAVDKELALEAMLDPSFFAFPGRSSWDQTELWAVNYYNTRPGAVLDVIGSLVAGDWPRLGGFYAAATDVGYRNYNDPSSTAAGQAMDPAVGFNLRIRALVYGVGLIYSGFSDRSFLESSRVVVVGSGEEPNNPALVPIDFTDPNTGKPYRAYSQLVDGVEVGVGARVLAQANAVATKLQDATISQEERVDAELALRRLVDLIEIMRSVVFRYEEAGFTGVNPDTRYP